MTSDYRNSRRRVLAWLVSQGTRTLPLIALCLIAAAPVSGNSESELRVKRDARRRTITLEVGPIRVPANLGYGAVAIPIAAGGKWDVNGWLRSFEVKLVDGNGRKITTSLIHHAALLAPGERDVFAPVTRRIVAFGQETSRIRLPGELGYRIEPGDSIALVGAFFNPSAETFEEVYLLLEMVYADVRRDVMHHAVLPIYLNAVPLGQATFDVPPGEVRQSWEWRPAVFGRVLGLGGHLHQYGVSVAFEDVTSGEMLWVAKAEYDDDGVLTGVSRKIFLRGLKVWPDHLYRVTATYWNPTDEVIHGAMGHIGGLFLPDDIEEMPLPDLNDPDYAQDLYAMQNSSGTHHHGGH